MLHRSSADCGLTYGHLVNSWHAHLGIGRVRLSAVLHECHVLKICLLISVDLSRSCRVHLTLRFLHLSLIGRNYNGSRTSFSFDDDTLCFCLDLGQTRLLLS